MTCKLCPLELLQGQQLDPIIFSSQPGITDSLSPDDMHVRKLFKSQVYTRICTPRIILSQQIHTLQQDDEGLLTTHGIIAFLPYSSQIGINSQIFKLDNLSQIIPPHVSPFHNFISFGTGAEHISNLNCVLIQPSNTSLSPPLIYFYSTPNKFPGISHLCLVNMRERVDKIKINL